MMANNELTEFEKAAVEHIAYRNAPEMKNHLGLLKVEKRESTGVGFYTYFEYTHEPQEQDRKTTTIGQSVYAEVEGIEGGVGFMLYIDDGKVTMLECYAHSSEMPPFEIKKYHFESLD